MAERYPSYDSTESQNEDYHKGVYQAVLNNISGVKREMTTDFGKRMQQTIEERVAELEG